MERVVRMALGARQVRQNLDLDDTRWAHLQTAFLSAQLNLLLAEFKDGEILAQLFAIENSMLSKRLGVRREDDDSDEERTYNVQSMLDREWGAVLALIAHPEHERSAMDLCLFPGIRCPFETRSLRRI